MLTRTLEAPANDAVDRCLDAESMRALLQVHLPECSGGAHVVEQVLISKARRSSSIRRNPHPLTLCYDVVLRGAEGHSESRRYYGKVYRDGASADAADADGTLHVSALDLRLWPFPADPGLRQLPALLDPAQTARWWGAAADEVTVLRHEPERRATLRYTRRLGTHRSEHLYAKTFRDGRAELIHRRFVHFWQAAQADERAPTVAQPLGWDAETRTLWQVAARGAPLLALLESGPNRMLSAAVARALIAVHDAPSSLAGAVPRDRAHWLTELERRRKKIGRATPEFAARADELAARMEAAVAGWPAEVPSLIHGDCHPDQLWLDGARIVLFDFDEFTLGDPMEDLAEFVTKLEAAPDGSMFATAVVGAYAQLAPARFSLPRLRWHLAMQQWLQASRAFIFQVPQWRQEIDRRLAQAESLAAPQGDAA